MNAHQLLTDVEQLKCHLCQDYLKMVLRADWRAALYEKARAEIEADSKQKGLYQSIFNKAEKSGPENLRAEDLDIFLIMYLVISDSDLIDHSRQSDQTKTAFLNLHIDRTIKGHLNENESDDVLYLYTLLGLTRMEEFLEVFANSDAQIPSGDRLAFKNQYLPKITGLESAVDDERIYLKEVHQYIKDIQESSAPLDTWNAVMNEVMKKYYLPKDKDPFKKYISFFFEASDAGIPYAHCFALIYATDPVEIEKRSAMMLHSSLPFTWSDAYYIIDKINICLSANYYSEELSQIIQGVRAAGYRVVRNNNNELVFE